MENRKGSGIFLGIVSVATLIVAIIGATFAYFSASTESEDGAVNVEAYEFKLSMNVDRIYPAASVAAAKQQLIPMNPTGTVNGYTTGNNGTNLLYAINEAEEKCIDGHGLQVCALYQVTIYNEAQNTVVMSGKLQTVSNVADDKEGRTPFTNLEYQGLTGNHSDGTLATSGAATPINTEDGIIAISDITVSGATTGEDGEVVPGTGTAYVLVYLKEAGDQSAEMGATFTGKLVYTSKDDAANQLSAMFSVGA